MEGGMVEKNEDKSLGFKWLKKKGVGGKDKKIQFYESFVYDEVEYTLYDCVYMYKEGYPEPYIGKVIKIWEHAGKTKKVKVQWFFYSWEILNYLGGKKVQDREIFLASGEGFGVANVNPLEAIAGKCNVVCISKDSRNAQPSYEELEAADYIFYRTFDVQSCTIFDKMDEKVGGLEIQYIFNRNKHKNASGIPELASGRKEDSGNATGCDKTLQLSSQNPTDISNTLKTDGNEDPSLVNTNVKGESVSRNVNALLVKRESVAGVKPASGTVQGAHEEAAAGADNGKTTLKGDSNYDETKVSKAPTDHAKAKERARFAQDSNNLKDHPGKKARGNNSIELHQVKDLKEKLPVYENGVKAPIIQVKVNERATSANDDSLKDQSGKKDKGDNSIKVPQDKYSKEKLHVHEKGVKSPTIGVKVKKEKETSAQDSDNLKDQSDKKARGDQFIKLPQDKDSKEKLSAREIDVKAVATTSRLDTKVNDAHETNSPRTGKGVKSVKDYDDPEGSDNLKDQSDKKARGDQFIKLPQGKDSKEKLSAREIDVKAVATTSRLDTKVNDAHEKNSPRTGKGVKSVKDYDDPEGRTSKKAKVDDPLNLSKDNKNNVRKLSTNNNGSNAKDVKPTDILSEDHKKCRLVLDSLGAKKEFKIGQDDEKVRKLSSGKLPKMSAIESGQKHAEISYQEFEITRRPDDDKSRWFRELPWEERLQKAYEQGVLVLLQNLDPDYTSEEVEGIIWHAFNESCTAKIVQHTAISSPFSGQALIIFKTRDATERVMKKMGTGCLMLSNGRPLVGSRGPLPNISGRQSTFSGHLVIDKIKIQMQREMKDAVSTSHCSQPNTIEYEMAMDWCALQTRSEIWWSKLYKEQRKQLQILEQNLKKN